MIQPILNNVVIRPIETDKTASGIMLTPDANQEVRKGVVISFGPGKITSDGTLHTPSIKVDEVVLFKTYSSLITEGTDKVYIIDNDEILGIIK